MWCQGFAICLLVAVSVLAMSVSSQTEEAIECEDFGEFCKKIGPSVCTEYFDFSMVYCRVFCGFCNDTRPTDGWVDFSFPPGVSFELGLSSLAPEVTSAAFDSSTDDVDALHSSTISGSTTYEGGESSGEVTSTLPGQLESTTDIEATTEEECEDFQEFCKKIGPTVCTEYFDFSMVYCRVFCGFCNDTRPIDGWVSFSLPPGFHYSDRTDYSWETTDSTREQWTESSSPQTDYTTTNWQTSESTTEPVDFTSRSAQDSTTEQGENTPYVEKDSSPWTEFEIFTTVESTTDIEATTEEDCCYDNDGILSCITHREESCVGIYKPWAGAHCQAYCGLCKPCPIEPCIDTNLYCAAYGKDVCSDPNFRIWAFENCMRFCDLCSNYSVRPYVPDELLSTETFEVTSTEIPMDTNTPTDCCLDQDGILSCVTHRVESCVGIYKPWAGAHCQAYCGLCEPCPIVPCVDTNEYCAGYGKGICSDPNFRIWAFENCMRFCDLCSNYSLLPYVPDELLSTETFEVTSTEIPMDTITPAGTTSPQPACRNLVTHCHEYGQDDCIRYKDFMTNYCPAYCQFCTPESGESGTTAFDPTAITKIPPNCNDTQDNCIYYSQDHCCNEYEQWARENCSRHCGFCGIPPERECGDIRHDCDGNPEESCTDYLFRINCAGFCKVCDEPWTPPFCAAYLYQETYETQEPRCHNKLSNCSRYREYGCCGIYEPWARDHCAEYCGFCGVIPPRLCHDTIPYCDREPEDLCTNDAWKMFREENCAGYCHVCDVPWTPPNCTAHLFTELPTTATMATTEMEISTTD